MATADAEGRVALWDLKAKSLRASLDEHDGDIFELTFNQQGTQICSACGDGYARVWETAKGSLVAALKHPNGVRSARFSPDGRTLLTASADSVRLYNMEQKQITLEFSAHESEIGAALYSADGKLIITCGLDATVRVWEASTGARLGILGGRFTSATDLQLSSDGRKLLVSHVDSTARMLDMPILPDALPSWWPPFLRAVSGRVISPSGSIVSVPLTEINELKRSVLKQIEMDKSPLAKLARWHLSSASERTIHPYANGTLSDHWETVLDDHRDLEGSLNRLNLAELQPHHPLALIAVAPMIYSTQGKGTLESKKERPASQSMRTVALEFAVKHLPNDRHLCQRAAQMLRDMGETKLALKADQQALAAPSPTNAVLPQSLNPQDKPTELKLELPPPPIQPSPPN